MFGSEYCSLSFWWILPLIMIVLCFLMMRRGGGLTMCGFGSRAADSRNFGGSDSATDMLDKRYALGEIDKEEYEEKKAALNQLN